MTQTTCSFPYDDVINPQKRQMIVRDLAAYLWRQVFNLPSATRQVKNLPPQAMPNRARSCNQLRLASLVAPAILPLSPVQVERVPSRLIPLLDPRHRAYQVL